MGLRDYVGKNISLEVYNTDVAVRDKVRELIFLEVERKSRRLIGYEDYVKLGKFVNDLNYDEALISSIVVSVETTFRALYRINLFEDDLAVYLKLFVKEYGGSVWGYTAGHYVEVFSKDYYDGFLEEIDSGVRGDLSESKRGSVSDKLETAYSVNQRPYGNDGIDDGSSITFIKQFNTKFKNLVFGASFLDEGDSDPMWQVLDILNDLSNGEVASNLRTTSTYYARDVIDKHLHFDPVLIEYSAVSDSPEITISDIVSGIESLGRKVYVVSKFLTRGGGYSYLLFALTDNQNERLLELGVSLPVLTIRDGEVVSL